MRIWPDSQRDFETGPALSVEVIIIRTNRGIQRGGVFSLEHRTLARPGPNGCNKLVDEMRRGIDYLCRQSASGE
jgi:hypothetical protein